MIRNIEVSVRSAPRTAHRVTHLSASGDADRGVPGAANPPRSPHAVQKTTRPTHTPERPGTADPPRSPHAVQRATRPIHTPERPGAAKPRLTLTARTGGVRPPPAHGGPNRFGLRRAEAVVYTRDTVGRVRVHLERPHAEGLEADALARQAARALRIPRDGIRAVTIARQALDARRHRATPTWCLDLDAEIHGRIRPRRGVRVAEPPAPAPRLASRRAPAGAGPVVIVGAGPAGLFAAWHLAEHGARVVLVERGKPVEARARDFGRFRGRGILNPESNLCFGEGGAGTYSDGKLTCRKTGPRVRDVLSRFVAMGAPARILVDAKPHIGTNKLFGVLKNLRARLVELGVDVRFETRIVGLVRTGGHITGVVTHRGESIPSARVLLAIGHSARDTFEWLLRDGIPIEPKPFSVGVRAEHPQSLVDRAQYRLPGERPATLPPADYRLAHTTGDGRGVYSFCMCPGGMVVPTATEPEMVVVNGMSSARRSTPFANSGLVAQVRLEDLAAAGHREDPLAGVAFQRALERGAFVAGGGSYRAPAMRAADFIQGRATGRLADSRFRPGLVAADLHALLPPFVGDALRSALQQFSARIAGYDSTEASLIGVETRTSSPVRIPREPETGEVPGSPGLLVAGEGPGYAGGIMSAAIDGLTIAHRMLETW